ncbi:MULTISPECIES: hypothetical protein [unclassified Streptomyces]|uniref:hypothetical protein n=1 Tax=unclassified Streptomyces TaxID=2593676 RepID=UPI000B846F46|nr:MULTISPECIES: hypothetical protein [unclassified Streptomyces]MYZ37921.1 hypothetical protein [Streptomyces sp. SID4917]
MTSDVDLVECGPQYADELTTDVVWEIGDFLLPRLERAASAHPSDSEEGITASALAEAVATLVLTLEWTITGGTPGRVRIPVGIPLPPMPTEEERRVRAEMRLDRLRDDWNTLCLLVGYWRSAPGYQDSRWRKLEFRDAEHERWYQQQLSYRRVESRVIRPPRQE